MSYTLSTLQRQVWASQLRYPETALQNMATLTHLDGAIDPERFADAFAAVVRASDVLRSKVGPLLAIHSAPPTTTSVIKVARKDAETWADQRNRTPLDMARASYDSVLLMHGDGTASWYLGLHHIVTDATSSALVLEATAKAYAKEPIQQHSFYDAISAGKAPQDHAGKRAAAHWNTRKPAPPLGDIYPSSTRKGPSSQQADIPIDTDLLAACLSGPYQMLSEGLAHTSIMVTASALFLHRLTGKHAFSIGLPVHLRGKDTANLIGPLMEMFPVDITLKPDDTHLTLFQRISESVLVTVMNAAPQTSPPGDYAMVVNVIPPNAAPTMFGDIPAQMAWRPSGAVDPDHVFRLHVSPYANAPDDQAGLKLDMNATLIPKPTRTRMPDYFATVLRGVLESPDAPIGARGICGANELAKIQGWEHSKGFGSPTAFTPARLKTALKDNAALVIDGPAGCLTGDQLWQKATEFAGGLQLAGLGKGCRIGISLCPSSEAVIAIYGTMLAGASYVPLDPAQPATRRDKLIKSAGIAQVFTSAKAVVECRGAFTPVKISGADEAYLMFTSGSTGVPKPVPISHSGLAHYLRFALRSYFDMAKPAIAPLFGSLTFDLSITTLFAPLLSGGRIIPIGQTGPAALAAIAEIPSINWLKATPSHLEILTRMLPKDHGLKTVIVGGEAFRQRLALDLGKINKDMRVYNEYGPTEAVVGCMIHKVDFADDGGPDVPIGIPAPGVTLRVVDSYGQRVPLGISGELWISHEGMTTGYEAGPDKAAFTTQDGLRFYRSGDLVRLGENMLLTYQGRIDDEIKTGGIRLNPAEVEDALNRHPLIQKSVVRAWGPQWRDPVQHCRDCGLPDNVPGVGFDENGVCDTCHDYKKVATAAQKWFGKPDDMKAIFAAARARSNSEYDCLHMLSGGKDSTYTLCRLIDLGYKPFVFTFDNGFIPASVKENIRKVVSGLRVDHEFSSTSHMKPIFRDSLATHSNVCNGCFKTLYTLATNRAEELGITLIVTGLSRGQLFETRLTPGQFRESRFDARAIDCAVVDARRVYHRLNDLPNRLLDTDIFADDTLFERIEFLDFFRYEDIALSEMLNYLSSRTKWRRPPDTGRSTNCLINVLGIHTHRLEQGYHNYAVPYAWDVRLGHKTRAQAIDELADDLDKAEITELQAMLGFEPTVKKTLTAWLVLASGAMRAPTPAELRAFLADLLPAYAVPDAFVELAEMPLTKNGKVDMAMLPPPAITHRPVKDFPITAQSETEKTIIAIWEQALRVEPISLEDDFFALGGDSLAALEMVIEVSHACKVNLPDAAGFSNTTPQALANLVDAMRGGRSSVATPASSPPGDTRSDNTPPVLSIGERTILFDQGRDQTSKKYNVCRIFKVAGAVDAPRFETALRKVARCHEPLNWSYAVPRKHLPTAQALSFRAAKTPISVDAADEAIQRLHRAVFDLENGPLMRCLMQPLDDKTTLIAFAIHHVSGDHDSFDQLWQQVNDVLAGAPPPSLSVGYAGFCLWQETELAEGAQTFWLDYPAQQPANPHCINRPLIAAPDGFLQQSCDLTPEAMRAVSGASPVTLAIAATAAALRPYHQRDNIGFALVSSSRTHAAAAGLFGYLLNPLPIEINCAPNTSLAGLGHAAAQVAGKVLPHRGYPLAQIIADRRAQNLALPQINILLSFDDAAPAALNGKPVQQQVAFNGNAVADLGFFVELREGRVDVSLEYSGKTVSKKTATTMLDRFSRALSLLVQNPATQVGQLGEAQPAPSLLIGPELLNKGLLLPQIIRHIANQPTAPACTCGAVSINWATLGARAAGIASKLADKGVKRGDMVLVYLPRSVDLVCAILGVMLAGAAYVPLDPDYPDAWVDDIKTRTKARFSISGADARVLTTNDIRAEDIARQGATATDLDVRGEDPAYVIFTSGSSGKPKGVAISHAQLAASTNARAQVYDSAPRKFALLSSVAFDSSIVGLFWTLASGGEVLLPDEAQAHDIDAITTLLGQGVTHTLCVPTLYQALLTRKSGAWPDQVIVAGEACPPALLKAHFDHAPASKLTNEYGLTEASVWSSYIHLEPTGSDVPIGQPIPGTWFAVLDSNGNICPQGMAGELVIGGAGVASGYLDSADETAKRFGNDGAGLPRGRFYQTGDKAVIKGATVHLTGRLDDQINLGGTRIEPGQIEQVLAGVTGVTAAVIVVRDAQLVAHLEIEGTDISGPKAAAKALPTQMRPAVYVPHTRLPRRPNGKIDRMACAQLPVDAPKAGVMPAEITEKLTQLFADELRVPRFTKTDNFFDHGGHSLMVVNLVLAIEVQLGVRLSTSDLFTAPSPIALARLIAGQQPAPASTAHGLVIPIQPDGDLPPLFAIQNLGDNCKHIRPLSARLGPNQPVYGLGDPVQVTLLGAKVADPARPYEISEIAAIYVAEIDRIAPTGPFALLAICGGVAVAYEIAQQLSARGRAPDLFVMITDWHAPYLALDTQKMSYEIRQSRWKKFKKNKPRYLIEGPAKLANLLRNRMQQIARAREIKAVKKAQGTGAPLSQKLQIRAYLERAYASMHSYVYRRYSGRVLILRGDQDQGFIGEKRESGWGDLLPDSSYNTTPGVGIVLMQEPDVEHIAQHIQTALNATHSVGGQPTKRVKRTDDFEISVAIPDDGFIAAPTQEQRNWIINQGLREFADALNTGHARAPEMNTGGGPISVEGRAQAKLDDQDIMEDWQNPVMQAMADAVCRNGGDILEIGFGRGVSSTMIQNAGVASHTIIECNQHIIKDLERWKAGYPGRDIRIINSLWEDAVDGFPADQKFDGIFFHTYPLSTDELLQNLASHATFAGNFFPAAQKLLKPGGKFSYFTNEADSLSRAHQRALLKYFGSFTISQVTELDISPDSRDAQWYFDMVIIEATAPSP